MNASTYYDPDNAPDPREWLAIDEHELVRLVKNFHEAARTKVTGAKSHALFHVFAENQIAQGFGPACKALDRLQKEGLSRHDALHAISSVMANPVFDSAQGIVAPSEAATQRALKDTLEALSATSWRQGVK